MRETADQLIREVESDVRRRQEQLRAEVRMLEQRKREAVERLQEVAALVQDVLPGPERDESLARDLAPQRQISGSRGSAAREQR
jgi:hypothetical protein